MPQLKEIEGIILEKRKSRTFHLKDDNYGVKRIIVTALDAVATIDVVKANKM